VEVEYYTTFDDYVAFNRHHRRQSWIVFCVRLMFYFFVLFWFVLCPIGMLIEDARKYWPYVAFSFAMAAAALPLHWILSRLASSLLLHILAKKKIQGSLGKTRLVLNDEWLTELTEAGSSAYMWRQVNHIDDTGDYLFIYVTRRSAAIIPKRAFASVGEFERLKTYAIRCFERQQQLRAHGWT